MFKKTFITSALLMTVTGMNANASIPSSAYMQQQLDVHANNADNPHSVTKGQVGLANVQNVDQTNANNITSGTVAVGRLPVGTVQNTVAAGNDARFNTIATVQPTGTPPSGHAFIWFE
ncbi:MAG: hypothetical protein IJN91_00050 [Alphaproteobacteria bacterium]|nr:hypothetical protein [Alphaproteobacteria bacterium]